MYNWLSRLVVDGAVEQRKSALIDDTLIDYFIPFLPLERQHIEMCIKGEFKKFNIQPSAEQIGYVWLCENIVEMKFIEWRFNCLFIVVYIYREVSSVVTFYKDLYAITGCKRIGQKVALTVAIQNS